jgi:hypothetical protein
VRYAILVRGYRRGLGRASDRPLAQFVVTVLVFRFHLHPRKAPLPPLPLLFFGAQPLYVLLLFVTWTFCWQQLQHLLWPLQQPLSLPFLVRLLSPRPLPSYLLPNKEKVNTVLGI